MNDSFVDLACLTYRGDDSRERRARAVAMLAETPSLVDTSARAAAAAGDARALSAHRDDLDAALLALCYSRIPQVDTLGCLALLLERGADPNASITIDENRFTALTGVMGEGEAGPFEQPPHPLAHAMAVRLLDAGADPNDSQGLYNTHFSPSNAWLELLLSRGLRSDLDFLLGQACVQGFTERVERLLAAGVSPNGRNRYNGRTHIENALLEGHREIAALLAAADPPTFDDDDRFQVAVLANDAREARRLSARTPRALMTAARHGRLDAVELAVSLGVPIDACDAEGLTALHHAARQGHLAVVRALIAHGASPHVRDRLYDGTPLGHARHFTERWPRAQGPATIAYLESVTA